MAQQIINVGTAPNDGLGDSIRTSFTKTNTNFSDLYSYFQASPPPSLRGSVGDHAGMIANDTNYFYYCFANFDGTSTIWAQIAQVGNVTLPSISNGTSNVVVSPSGNVSVGIAGIPNIGVFGTAGFNVLGQVAVTGNVSGANITAISTVSAAAITSSTDISAVGNIAGNYILGNGSLLTGVSADYGNANVSAFLPVYGGNIAADEITATGNITGNYVLGNGSQLTGLPATYTNANVAEFLPTYSGNLASMSGIVVTTANITGGNLRTIGQVSATGNITGSYILGNGSQLTGLPSTYTNANVTAFLPTYSGNLASLGGDVQTQGAVSAQGNITGSYILGNGSQLTGLPATYTNANVTAFLPTYSGNLGANNISVTNSVSVAGVITGNLTGLVNGLDIRYLSFDFGFVDTTSPYTNPIQYLLAYTGAGNIDMGSISAPSALNIDAGGTMQ
jgi:hypothetical protein